MLTWRTDCCIIGFGFDDSQVSQGNLSTAKSTITTDCHVLMEQSHMVRKVRVAHGDHEPCALTDHPFKPVAYYKIRCAADVTTFLSRRQQVETAFAVSHVPITNVDAASWTRYEIGIRIK